MVERKSGREGTPTISPSIREKRETGEPGNGGCAYRQASDPRCPDACPLARSRRHVFSFLLSSLLFGCRIALWGRKYSPPNPRRNRFDVTTHKCDDSRITKHEHPPAAACGSTRSTGVLSTRPVRGQPADSLHRTPQLTHPLSQHGSSPVARPGVTCHRQLTDGEHTQLPPPESACKGEPLRRVTRIARYDA